MHATMWGGQMSHDSTKIAEAEAFSPAEGNMCCAVNARPDALPGSKNPPRMDRLHRNLRDLLTGRAIGTAPVRVRKTRSRSGR
jgi:hypothetical protein